MNKMIILLAGVLVLGGCKAEAFLEGLQGSYFGTENFKNLESRSNDPSGRAGKQDAKIESEQVVANVTLSNSDGIEISISKRAGSSNLRTIRLRVLSSFSSDDLEVGGLELLGAATLRLKRDSGDCFSIRKPLLLDICFGKGQITIDAERVSNGVSEGSYRLLLNQSAGVVDEATRPYKISELFNSAVRLNINSRLQLENFLQERARARNAYLNLLPHLSGNSILGLVSGGGLTGALQYVGDLAPFLLPNRWLQAEEQKELREAQGTGVALVRLDAAQSAEGLAFGVLRDQQFLEVLESNEREVHGIWEEVKFREQVGQLPAGSADEIAVVLNGVERDSEELKNLIQQGYSGLAIAAGMMNPKAIAGIVDDMPGTIDQPESFSEDELKKRALDKSYELQQLDWLIQAAKTSTEERYFNWIDPAGDGAGGLGAGLSSYIEIGKSMERQLVVQRENSQALLLAKVSNSVALGGRILERYRLAHEGLMIQERRVNRYLQNHHLGIGFSMIELASSLRDRAQAQLENTLVKCEYRVNLSLLQRLGLTGPFSDIKPPDGVLLN